jgi:hypothetical protein
MFTKSQSFTRLSSSFAARRERAETAIRAAGISRENPIDNLRAAEGPASGSICKVGPLSLLVSYRTVVAFIRPDGSSLSVSRNFYSKTTQNSIDRFMRGRERRELPENLFLESLLSHYV